MQNIPLLDPRRDVVFKTIFSQDNEESLTARNSLLSALLDRNVKDSIVMNNDLPVSDIRDKAARLDLHCIIDDGHQVNIEMQMCNSVRNLEDRLIYYLCQLYSSQSCKGEPYKIFKEVYVVLISNETVLTTEKEFISKILLRYSDGRVYSTKLNITVLELSKISEEVTLDSAVFRWGLYLKTASDNNHKELVGQLINQDRGILMANTLLSKITQSDYERARVMERERILMDYYSDLDYAVTTGLEQGKLEQKREIAAAMKMKSIHLEQICEITGLSIQEVESL